MNEQEKRDLVLKIATSKIGIKEFPAGSNNVIFNTLFYGKEVHDGDKPNAKYPWCGTFVSEVCQEAKLPLGKIGYTRGFAGCPYAIAFIKNWGIIVTVPKPGDVTFYDWEGDGKFDHTGFFEKDLGGGLFSAIEGNTSFKNNSNGGEVMRRSDRKYKNAIFVRPNIYNEQK